MNDGETLIRMCGHGQIIQPGNQTEPKIQNMKRNEEKQNDSRHALNRVEPVSGVRIIQVIRPRLDRNHQTIQRVIDQRNKNAADLDEQDVRYRLKILNRIVEISRTGERF